MTRALHEAAVGAAMRAWEYSSAAGATLFEQGLRAYLTHLAAAGLKVVPREPDIGMRRAVSFRTAEEWATAHDHAPAWPSAGEKT